MHNMTRYDVEEILMLGGVEAQLGQLCPEGQFRDAQGNCVSEPPPQPCPPGSIWSEGIQTCVMCPADTVWDEGKSECVPMDPSHPLTPPGFVAPGAVPVVPSAWKIDAQPYARYTLQWGDTYVGLSATYLGEGARWKEIWNLNRAQHPDPDTIYVTQVINMPEEARQKLRRWLKGKKKGKPGELPVEPTYEEKVKGALPWILAAAVVAGGAYYLAS